MRKYARIYLCILIVLLLMAGVLLGRAWYARWCCERAAAAEYTASRSSSSNRGTVQWVTRGVVAGATEPDVDNVLRGAARVLRHMPQQSPRWDGFVSLYVFEYGPKYRSPWSRNEYHLLSEWIWVYFSRDGRAVRIRCSLEGTIADAPVTYEVDLRSQDIDKKRK